MAEKVRAYEVRQHNGFGAKEPIIAVGLNKEFVRKNHGTADLKAEVKFLGWAKVFIDTSDENLNKMAFHVQPNGHSVTQIPLESREHSYLRLDFGDKLDKKQYESGNQYGDYDN